MKAPYVTIKRFISTEECNLLRQYGVENFGILKQAVDINPRFNDVTIPVENIVDKVISEKMLDIISRTRRVIESAFNTRSQYLDHSSISIWPTGMDLGAHADNMFWDTGEKNYVPHRTYSAVLYLNEDYMGGEFCWHDLEEDKDGRKSVPIVEMLKPEPGTLIAFGAGIEYIHSVLRVKDGTRWTVPLWFTDDLSAVKENYRAEKYM